MAKPIKSSIITCQVIFKILKIIVGTGKRSDALYIKVNFITTSSNKHHVYAADPSQILIPSYYLKVYI